MSDEQVELPPGVDHRLWIRTSECESPDYLFGNPHTFRGRMHAYCPHGDLNFAVSMCEVTESSIEAKYWIAGYLHGSELRRPKEGPADDAWKADRDAFHVTGDWPH
ncbi:hypothetical protein [Nocardioides baekrokdamisoli]|uniref:hypothetical protein n=1 Tax=Nocardioides baekrokdamisoli TaxID=1804624 RepID=UPI000F7A7C37|nr:hypothetical protein [Nocardioides baekrokdamisoli]